MWGKKGGSDYSDQMYRSRGSGGFNSTSKCCCFYLTRSVVIVVLLIAILGAGACSVLSDVFGYSQRWTFMTNRDVSPAYNIRTGWLDFSDNRAGGRQKLRELSKAAFIIGWIAVIMNAISALMALFFSFSAAYGKVGRGFICTSTLFSILLIASLVVYYVIVALQINNYSQRVTGKSKLAWPDWAWALGAGSALLWLIAAGLASVLPKKSKYFEAEDELQRQITDPNRPYAQPPPPVQNYNPQGYVPSSNDLPAVQASVPPMAAQENTEGGYEKKTGFKPSWGRKASRNAEVPAVDIPEGSYTDKANAIADRYKNRNVEMGSTAPAYKGAW